jgi:uncharacterized protein YjbJ (UPF0337 family)
MSWAAVQGKLNEWKGQIKEKWGLLTDNDLAIIDGQRDILIGSLQNCYGMTHEAARSMGKRVFEADTPRRLESLLRRENVNSSEEIENAQHELAE